MLTPLQLIILLATLTFFSLTATASFSSLHSLQFSSPPPPPPSPPLQCDHATILSALGFHQLSSAAAAASSLSNITTPITIFAPTDSSLLSCPSCSLPLLLLEHSVPRLYPLHHLRNFAFSTKIQTLAPNRCLTATATATSSAAIFINGAEITHPDLFTTGHFIVHGIQGFVSHLSPLSCNLEQMTTLSFHPPATIPPPPSLAFHLMPLMLKDAMLRLRTTGYSVLALAMRNKYAELLSLTSLTVFALDDASIFTGGPNYVSDLSLHIVPNRKLMSADLENLPENTALPTMEPGENLVVTTAGGGGPLAPIRINYVKIKCVDMVFNSRISVHGLSMPFRRIISNAPAPKGDLCQVGGSGLESEGSCGTGEMVDPNSGTASMVEVEGHDGL